MLASKVSRDRKDTQPARDCSHRKLAVVISQEIAAHPLLWELLALDFLNLDNVSVLLRNIRLDEYNQSNTMGMNIIINSIGWIIIDRSAIISRYLSSIWKKVSLLGWKTVNTGCRFIPDGKFHRLSSRTEEAAENGQTWWNEVFTLKSQLTWSGSNQWIPVWDQLAFKT